MSRKYGIAGHGTSVRCAELIQRDGKPGDQQTSVLWPGFHLYVDRRLRQTLIAITLHYSALAKYKEVFLVEMNGANTFGQRFKINVCGEHFQFFRIFNVRAQQLARFGSNRNAVQRVGCQPCDQMLVMRWRNSFDLNRIDRHHVIKVGITRKPRNQRRFGRDVGRFHTARGKWDACSEQIR